MPSRWENLVPFVPSLHNTSGLACTSPRGLHYLDGNRDVVCRCTLSRHHDRRRVRNPDIKALSVAFFRHNQDKILCSREQWRAYWGLPALHPPRRVHGSIQGFPERAYAYQQLHDMAMNMFHEDFAIGVSPLDALDEAYDFMFQHTGETLTSTGQQTLLDSLPASVLDAITAVDEDTDVFDGFSRLGNDLPNYGGPSLQPSFNPPRPNVASSSGEGSHNDRASRPRERSREAPVRSSAARQQYQPTRAATEQQSTTATGRGHTRDALQRAQLHDQRWNAGINETVEKAADRTAANVPVSRQQNGIALERPAGDHQTQQSQVTRSTSGSLHGEGPSPEPVRLPSDFPVLRQNHVSQDSEIDEVKSACLQMVLDVIPDVATEHVLAMINAMPIDKTSVRLHSVNIINQLLEAESYPKDPQDFSNEDSVQVQHITRAECMELVQERFPNVPAHYIRTVIGNRTTRGTLAMAHVEEIIDQLSKEDRQPQGVPYVPAAGAVEHLAGRSTMPSREVRNAAGPTGVQNADRNPSPPSNAGHHPEPSAPVELPSHNTCKSPNKSPETRQAVPEPPSEAGRQQALRAALDEITSPSQNPWHDSPIKSAARSPESSPESAARGRRLLSPPKRPYNAAQLNALVTSLTHNGWRESPDRTTVSNKDPHPDSVPFASSSAERSRAKSTPLFRRFQEACSSAHASPGVPVTPDVSESDSDSDHFLRGPVGPDLFVRSQSEAVQAEGSSRAARPFSLHVGTPGPARQPCRQTKDQSDSPDTPMPRRQRELLAARDESPCARVSGRHSRRQPTGPVDIDGLYEYIVPEEIAYGANVSGSGSVSLWEGNPRSFDHATASTQNASDPPTPEQGSSRRERQRVRFESPVADSRQYLTDTSSSASEKDVTPPRRHRNYRSTPERARHSLV